MRLAELVGAPDQYFGRDTAPLQQGDIILAPVARLQTDAVHSSKWDEFDAEQVSVDSPDAELPDMVVHVGYGPVMVVTHDCHLDRELVAEATRLRARNRRLKLADARAQLEDDRELDRFIQVVPLVAPTSLTPKWAEISRGQVIGAFPVPAAPDRGLSDSKVADLTYRSTVDRNLIVARYAVLSDEARSMLRFALARHDVFRTPEIGFALEAAVGKRIVRVTQSSRSPLHVILELNDATTLELLHPPAEVTSDDSTRTLAPPSVDPDDE